MTVIKLNLLDRETARRPLFTALFMFALIVTVLIVGALTGAEIMLTRQVQAFQKEMSAAGPSREDVLARAQTLVEREGKYRAEAETLLGLLIGRYRQADLMRALGNGLPDGVRVHKVISDLQGLEIHGAAPGAAELDALKRALSEALELARFEQVEPVEKRAGEPGPSAFRLIGEW